MADPAGLLELAPVRCAEWQEQDGFVVVVRPEPRSRGLRGVLERLSFMLSPRRLRFDELGSSAWRRMDGVSSAAEIAAAVARDHPNQAADIDRRFELFVDSLVRLSVVAPRHRVARR